MIYTEFITQITFKGFDRKWNIHIQLLFPIIIQHRPLLVENHTSKDDFPDVKFLMNENGNKGAGTCRNIGIDSSDGKWLIFADADDYFMPELYTNLKEYVDKLYDIVYFTPRMCL